MIVLSRAPLFFSVASSYLRLIGLKLCYGSRLRIKLGSRILLGPSSTFELGAGHGEISFAGKFIIRRNSIIRANGGRIDIGDRFFANSNCTINAQARISIGRDVLLGEGVRIYDHDHTFGKGVITATSEMKYADVNIGNNVWIGSNSVILRGTRLGSNCVVGAGCVVQGDFPECSLIRASRALAVTSIQRR